jgi:aminopeptidase YwaD
MLTAPGANDNASGSAGIMEIARILSEYDFEFSIEFILFDHEEPVPHLLGSQYASNLSHSYNENIIEMINLDMIGYCPDDIYDIQIHSPDVEHISDFISIVTEFSGILPYKVENYLSDDKSYGDLGYTTLGISEHTFPSVRDYPWYHSSDDRLDKLNFSFTSEVIKFTLAGICMKAIPIVE